MKKSKLFFISLLVAGLFNAANVNAAKKTENNVEF